MNKNLVIITGANGKLGEAYTNFFSSKSDFDTILISRSGTGNGTRVFKQIQVDLLDKKNVKLELSKINFPLYQKIFLIHPVGKFKFQKNASMGISNEIENEVFLSNVVTLENILTPIIYNIENEEVLIYVCAFGSISDKYGIPFWKSYSKSKNILRDILKRLTEKDSLRNKLSVLFVNVSSVDTGNENKLRPYADKQFWLKPEKIVEKSTEILFSDFKG